MEVREPQYANLYLQQIDHLDVVDIDAALPGLTIVADITNLEGVSDGSFNAIILSQTLQYVFDTKRAIEELHRVLAPGGVLLLTVPAVERMRMIGGFEHDCWRFTVRSVEELLEGFTAVSVKSYGNCLAAIAVYRDVPAARLKRRLWMTDPLFPVVVAARAQK